MFLSLVECFLEKFNVLVVDLRCCEVWDLFCFKFRVALYVYFVLKPLVFVGADGKFIDPSDGMARCKIAMAMMTCVNELSMIKGLFGIAVL